MQAALQGAQEIGFAVVAMTLTLAAVYAPLAFTTGRTGQLFIEFALTLAGAVLVSGFVALTLSPMMCSLLLKHEEKHGKAFLMIEGFLNWLNSGYKRVLTAALGRRWIIMTGFVAVAAASVALLGVLKSELAPVEDRGVILGVFLGPDGATLDYTDKYARQIEGIYSQTKDVDRFFVVSGNPTVSQGISFVGLTDWNERDRSSPEIAKELFPKFMGIPGVLAFPITPPSLGQSSRERPINFVIVTSASYEELQQVTSQFLGRAGQEPRADQRRYRPQAEQAGALGRGQPRQGGRHGRPRRDHRPHAGNHARRPPGHALQARRRTVRRDRAGRRERPPQPGRHRDIYVRGRDGSMISLDNLVDVSETIAPRELNHFSQRRAVTITANLAPGYTMGEALSFMDGIANQMLQARLCDRLQRPDARVPPVVVLARADLRPGAGVHLPGAGGAVRELPRSRSSSC